MDTSSWTVNAATVPWIVSWTCRFRAFSPRGRTYSTRAITRESSLETSFHKRNGRGRMSLRDPLVLPDGGLLQVGRDQNVRLPGESDPGGDIGSVPTGDPPLVGHAVPGGARLPPPLVREPGDHPRGDDRAALPPGVRAAAHDPFVGDPRVRVRPEMVARLDEPVLRV